MIKKLMMLMVLATMVVACPDPTTGKIDPYLTARSIILQANTAVALADGIFQQWLLGQTNTEKLEKAQHTYVLAKSGVVNGLQMALNGVNIAQQAKTDPDIVKLMAEANEAWGSLRSFLEELFATPVPTTQPAVAIKKSEVSPDRAKLKLTKKPKELKNLPKTLTPS